MPTNDSMPRVMIERNLAISFAMQTGEYVSPDTIAASLPPYELADSFEERAVTSAMRVMSAVGLELERDDGKACLGELTAWFADHDTEVDLA